MKNLLTLLLLFINLVLFSIKGHTTTYYFSSTDGDDSRTSAQAQNSATPWKTIDKLNSFFNSIQPGDQILFKRGDIFYGSITVTKSGTSGSPITFGAYGSGAKPIITGFSSITSWSSLGSGLYEATVSAGLSTLNSVTLDGAFQVMGKYPKGNSGYLTISSGGTSSVSSSGLSGVPNFTGGEIVWRPYHWVLWRGTVSSQSSSSVSFTAFASTSGGPTEAAQAGYGFFFQNHPNACTSLGEWAYNSSSHKVTMYFGGNAPTSHVANVSSIENIISLSGRSYITFDNVAVTGANSESFYLTSSNNITINSCDILFSGHDAISANSSCSNVTVTNCTIDHANFNGIVGGSATSWNITGNTLTNMASVAGMGGSGEGQYFGIRDIGNNSTVSNNNVINSGYVPINFKGTNVTIQNNFVDTFCTAKDDGGGIYCGGFNFSGSKIISNIVTNGIGALTGTPDKDSRTHGIYIDDGASNVEVGGNSVAYCGYSGIYTHNSHDLNIHNNTTFDNKTTGIKYYNDGNTIAKITLSNNIFFAKTSSEYVSMASGGSTSPVNFFASADNNYWCRPLNENSDFQILVPSSASYNLSGWKTFTGKETNSHTTAVTVTDASKIRFEYNATSSSKVVSFGATYMDVTGKNYSGSITLAPFTSAVLIYVSGTVSNQSPVANAGANQNFFLPTNSTTLNGSGVDPDGTIASYQWTKISGPSQYTIVSPTQAQTAVNNLVQGVYQFELKVTDNAGAIGKDTVTVTVNGSSNQSPVANAGSAQIIVLPVSTVILDGSKSTDADGTITSYQWTKISGPASAVIATPTLATTTVTTLVQGVYQFELKVTDNAGAIGKDTVTVTVNADPNQPPVANAGLDINITLPLNSVTLNGSGTDADGTVASYQWARVSGPSQYSIASATQPQTTVNNLTQGVYQFELKVTDNSGAADRDTVQVVVNAQPPNQAPTANAGIDINITLPTNSVTLSGSGSDPDGTIASYQWTKVAGPSQYSIVSSTQTQTSVNNLAQGVYKFELKVTDNAGAVDRDTVQVIVNAAPNQPPVADAGPDVNITLPTNNAKLLGSGSDGDGTIAAYQWTKISGPSQYSIASSTQAQTTINNLVQGVYYFELKVTDNSGAVDRDTAQVTVNAAPINQPPTADAGSDITITLPVNSVTLDGSGADADGTIAAYQWSKISGPVQYTIGASRQAQTTVNNLTQGVYLFELKVTDDAGATGRDSVQITVNPAPVNQLPTADAGLDINITLPSNSINLTGSGSDADGTIASYQWTKISGPSQYTIVSPSQAQTTVNNLVQGVYLFELKVTDNSGGTGRDTVQVIVNPAPPNQSPAANAGSDINITLPVNTVTLTGSGSDPDGNVVSYQWTKVSGPSQYNIVSPTQPQTTINNLVQGIYKFELKVTDNQGAVGRDTVTVTVNNAPNQPPTADAGNDITITLPTNSVTLNGGGNDPDGFVVSYQWTKISGPSQYNIRSSNRARSTIDNLVEGVYTFELRVTDNSGATGRDTITITVNAPLQNQLPSANAGPDINITLPVNSVSLNGSGNDPDGNIVAYQWTKISGPSQYNIVSPANARTSVNNLVEGVYQFELKVTDNSGATARDTVQVTVNAAANQLPSANAGPDITITLPVNSVSLNGSGNDPDGNIVSYQWTKISGPSQYNIVPATQAQTTVSNLVQGVYQFELKVTDNSGATARDTVQVTVNAAANQLPSANAGTDINITLPVNSVSLNGSGNDPDGIIVSYQWTKISGPSQFNIVSPTQAQTTVNNLVQGVYQFELKVTDNSGATAIDTVQVTVNAAANQLPSANAGPDITITLPVNSVSLNGSGNDPDGIIVSYQWTKISGPSQYNIVPATQAQSTVNNLVQGVYQFELKVTDNSGATARDTVQVTVNAAANQLPSANAGPDITITLPVNSVSLNGSGNDPDGNIVAYQWTKVSGPSQYNIVPATQAQTTVSNLVQGVYQFELKVTDNSGATARDTVQVTVNAAPNQLPSANAGTDINITLPVNSVSLNGSGNDPDGIIVSYQWTKISGPSQFNIVSPTQAQTTVNNLVQGVYQFELKVTDNSGATARDTVQVTVNAAPNQLPSADAGPDITITLPVNSVSLNGTGNDPDGNIVSYQWTNISGPSQFNIVSPTQAQTTINNLVQGVYQFELTVTDNSGATAKDTIQVTVHAASQTQNQAPIASAGPDITITLPTDSATLSGSGTDPDGNVVSYQWTKISGPSQYNISSLSQPLVAINNLVQGVYQFELKVTDNSGATGKDTVQVTVNAQAANQPPVANAGPDIDITMPVNSTILAGSGTDADGTIASYEWRNISGPSGYTASSALDSQMTVSDLVPGEYQFELTVTDNSGAIGKDTVKITLNEKLNSKAKVFPNPATSTINIQLLAATKTNNTNIRIYDSKGLIVYQENFVRQQQTMTKKIDIRGLTSGVYYVEMNVDINKIITLIFVKQ